LNSEKTKIVIFADLDGSLLSVHYSHKATEPVLTELLALGATIVFCSSKTRAEILYHQKQMKVNGPFISENGSAVFVPRGYFANSYSCTKQTSQYDVIELGIPYWLTRQKLKKIKRETHSEIIGFGELTANQLSAESGLPNHLSRLAKKREYDEPFRILRGSEEKIVRAAENQGLCCTKGDRYLHLIGNTNKGKAVALLTRLYSEEFREVLTLGVGDSANDLPMLEQVDVPFFVTKELGEHSIELAWKRVLGVCLEDVGAPSICKAAFANFSVQKIAKG
jgi:mannosyl-3-phosphoglycerate phosphatase